MKKTVHVLPVAQAAQSDFPVCIIATAKEIEGIRFNPHFWIDCADVCHSNHPSSPRLQTVQSLITLGQREHRLVMTSPGSLSRALAAWMVVMLAQHHAPHWILEKAASMTPGVTPNLQLVSIADSQFNANGALFGQSRNLGKIDLEGMLLRA